MAAMEDKADAGTLTAGTGIRDTPVLYFGYGSNLSISQMAERCPESRPVGLAHLSGLRGPDPGPVGSGSSGSETDKLGDSEKTYQGRQQQDQQHQQEGWRWIINERGYANVVHETVVAGSHSHSGSSSSDRSWSWTTWWRHGDGQHPSQKEDHQQQQPGVFGLLYAMTASDLSRLDRFEGWPHVYDRRVMMVRVCTWRNDGDNDTAAGQQEGASSTASIVREIKEGELVPAIVYFDEDAVIESRPRKEYVGRINRGIREAREPWGLPEWYIERVLRRFVPADG